MALWSPHRFLGPFYAGRWQILLWPPLTGPGQRPVLPGPRQERPYYCHIVRGWPLIDPWAFNFSCGGFLPDIGTYGANTYFDANC